MVLKESSSIILFCALMMSYSRSLAKKPRYHRRCRTIATILFIFLVCVWMGVFVPRIASCYIGWVYFYRDRCTGGGLEDLEMHSNVERESNSLNVSLALAIITDDFLGDDLTRLLIENKRRYAAKWGYGIIIPIVTKREKLAHGLPLAWSKFSILKEAFEKYEYVMMLDGDTVIMRDDLGLLGLIRQLGQGSLLISNDLNGPNSGVFLMRNTFISRLFIDQALKASQFLSHKTFLLPLRYENRAFSYLLDMWPKCGPWTTRVDAWLAPVSRIAPLFQSHVVIVDRCGINRRPPRARRLWSLLDSGAAFDSLDDAFIVHSAGGDTQSKRKALYDVLDKMGQTS